MELSDLYNPEGIISFLHTNGNYIELEDNQGIQVYYKDKDEKIISRLEIWQKMDNGMLLKVVGFRRQSILATYIKEKE